MKLYYPLTLLGLILALMYWGNLPPLVRLAVIANVLLAIGRGVYQILQMRKGH